MFKHYPFNKFLFSAVEAEGKGELSSGVASLCFCFRSGQERGLPWWFAAARAGGPQEERQSRPSPSENPPATPLSYWLPLLPHQSHGLAENPGCSSGLSPYLHNLLLPREFVHPEPFSSPFPFLGLRYPPSIHEKGRSTKQGLCLPPSVFPDQGVHSRSPTAMGLSPPPPAGYSHQGQ